MTALFQSWGASYEWAWFWSMVIGILVIALPLMLAVAMIIYAERKIWAAMALRRGPNVVGPWGLLQSFADGLKVFLKETIVPTSAPRKSISYSPSTTRSGNTIRRRTTASICTRWRSGAATPHQRCCAS